VSYIAGKTNLQTIAMTYSQGNQTHIFLLVICQKKKLRFSRKCGPLTVIFRGTYIVVSTSIQTIAMANSHLNHTSAFLTESCRKKYILRNSKTIYKNKSPKLKATMPCGPLTIIFLKLDLCDLHCRKKNLLTMLWHIHNRIRPIVY
jgi:hypothetical protein